MQRIFNPGGPSDPERNYMLPAMRRLPTVRALIDNSLYFVVHAPRQSGKTTALLSLARELTAEGRYAALLVSMEVGAPFVDREGEAEDAILASWRQKARLWLPADLQPPPWPEAPPGARIGLALAAWAQASPRPLVVFLDEIDALQNETLMSVLRQIRSGYADRPRGFPHSLALIGLRDVRDYKVASGGSDRLRTSSPFNIKAESLTVRNFSRNEVAELYGQHTADTGQPFTAEAIDRAFFWTQGQPWLVNALARQLVEQSVPHRSHSVTGTDVDEAKGVLIRRQDTHLDSLAERLQEDRVRRIMEPLLAGGTPSGIPDDDFRYVVDLGLLRLNNEGGLEVANPIYREVVPRALASGPERVLPHITPIWLRADGSLDTERLLEAFLNFWRQHGEPLFKSAPYHEIAPHLVVMAFLHRVVNGGGTIEREYAVGSGRLDLCVRFGGATLALELKVWRDGEPDPVEEGLEQLDRYLAGLSLPTGWLIIFDRRSGQPRLSVRTGAEHGQTPGGRAVVVIRA
jgi:hypothetical protein